MSDIKISDKLLSWVFGCKCEFIKIFQNEISYTHDECEFDPLSKYGEDGEINIFEFIHLAKIKACEKGFSFEIDTNYEYLAVSTRGNFQGASKIFTDTSPFDIETDLKALEWVVEKVGGEQ